MTTILNMRSEVTVINTHLQAWQAFLRRLLISQLLLTGQLYSMFPWMVLLKNALQASQEETP